MSASQGTGDDDGADGGVDRRTADGVDGPAAGGSDPRAAGGTPGPEGGVGGSARRGMSPVVKRIIVWTVVIAVAVVLVMLAASFVPRWWAQTVGNLVDNSFGRGVWWGLAIGFVFSLLPVLLIARAVRRWNGWKAPLTLVIIGVLFAAPNLFTLWIVIGTSSAAHAAERTLDVNAPFFRGATVWGVIIGVLAALAIEFLWRGWRQRGKRLQEMRTGERPAGRPGSQ